jgi:hypothetical protein
VVRKIKQAVSKLKQDNERGARRAILEDLFYDFNRSRAQVYVMNFVRGIMFGAGSVIGGTLVIAAIIWILSMLANVIPPLDDFFSGISSTLERDG